MIASRSIYLIKVTGDYHTQYRYVKAAIEGTGITLTTTQNNTGDRFIRDLYGEANSNYSTSDIHISIPALYGIMGGSNLSHRFNWMDTRDLNEAFRLVFPNDATHSTNGIDWNGTNQYAKTFFIPSVHAAGLQNSFGISYYSRDNVTESTADMGINSSNGPQLTISYGGSDFSAVNMSTTGGTGYAPADTRGLFSIIRTASDLTTKYKNGISGGTMSLASVGLTSGLDIFIGAVNDTGNPTFFSSRQCALAAIHKGLTATETLNFYNAVQAYQTSLSRNV